MKILMFGRGVISTQYAWAFEKSGHKVEFYVRPGRKADYGSSVTLNILDARKKTRGLSVREEWPITMVEDFTANHDYDFIFLGVQHYQSEKAADFLANRVGKATVVMFSNCWNEPKEVIAKLPQNQVVWGFPFAGGGFDKAGVLNGAISSSVKLGVLGNQLSARDKEVIHLFKTSGIKAKVQKDFRSWLFSHFVFDAAYSLETLKTYSNGASASLEELQSIAFWRNVIENGKELLPLLKARDVNLKVSPELKLFSTPAWLVRLMMTISIQFLPPIRRLLASHSNHVEMQSYCADVFAKAKELNVELPRFKKYSALFETQGFPSTPQGFG